MWILAANFKLKKKKPQFYFLKTNVKETKSLFFEKSEHLITCKPYSYIIIALVPK